MVGAASTTQAPVTGPCLGTGPEQWVPAPQSLHPGRPQASYVPLCPQGVRGRPGAHVHLVHLVYLVHLGAGGVLTRALGTMQK